MRWRRAAPTAAEPTSYIEPPRPDAVPAGAYEERFRLDRSYRRWGMALFLSGVILFFTGIIGGDPWLFLFSGVGIFGGAWIWRNDPREYYILIPRRRRLQVVRAYGRRQRVRAEHDVDDFHQLEFARYHARHRGMRAVAVLRRPDGTAEALDDRPDDDELPALLAQLAEHAGLEFLDRGRVDQTVKEQPERLTSTDDEVPGEHVEVTG